MKSETQGLIISIVLILAWFALFSLYPSFDLSVSAWFYDGKWLGRQGILPTFRHIYLNSSKIILVLFCLLLISASLQNTHIPRRVYGFFVALGLVAPLGIVNGILKAHWGRARPNDVIEFGDDKTFTPVQLFPADQCNFNCSFVSGEGAACFTILLMALTMFGGNFFRNALILLLILPMGILRVIAGAHFLSDVLGSFLIVSFCFYALLLIMKMSQSDLRVDLQSFWADAKGLVGIKS